MNVQLALVFYYCFFTTNVILLPLLLLYTAWHTHTDARAELPLVHLLRSDIILLPLYY
jgi:cellulose synthase/poly-beta-1,6-N-acetylglucosamine synthase-like glycosyltransferase